MLAATTIALFLLNLRRSGEQAGPSAGRLSISERTHEIQRQMLDAASRRPPDRDALADRLRPVLTRRQFVRPSSTTAQQIRHALQQKSRRYQKHRRWCGC
jgi:hypothetical protein